MCWPPSDRCPLQEAPSLSSSPGQEQLEALKVECSDAGCKIQSLQAEIESIRALVREGHLTGSPDRVS